MYLVIGFDDDPCGELVVRRLRARGDSVLVVDQPLAGGATFGWTQTDAGSVTDLQVDGLPAFSAADVRGVLVRRNAAHAAAAESHAALYAWLWTLSCPVVNRLSPQFWFRGHRSPLEWQPLLRPHGLSGPSAIVTSDPLAARAFGDRWAGTVAYQPITSETRYPIATERDWLELGKILAHVPVCLLEPLGGPLIYVCCVADQLIWSQSASGLEASARKRIETGIKSLGHALQVAAFEVEFGLGTGGPVCLNVRFTPVLDHYPTVDQRDIVEAFVSLLSAAA